MNNPNDIVQVKHADSITAAIKDFVQFHSENSSGNDFNLFFDDGAVKCFMPTASLSGNIVTCGNDSITLTGFADNLTLQDSKFFDSNNNQVGSLTFNITDCRYDFNFSSDALSPNLQSGDTISVNSDAPCRLSCSAFPDNNYWHESIDYDWPVVKTIGEHSFTLYDYAVNEKTEPYIKQLSTNTLVFFEGASSVNGVFHINELILAEQVVGTSAGEDDWLGPYRIGTLSSTAFWLENFTDENGKLGKTLVVTNATFGLSAGASLADFSNYCAGAYAGELGNPYSLPFFYKDTDDDETNDLVGNVRYEGNLASKPFPESFVENADGSYTYTAAGMGLGLYTDTELTKNVDVGTGYALKYRYKATGGDTFSLSGFAPGLTLRDNILYLGSWQVGTFNDNILTVTDFRALDIAYLSAGGSRAVSLIDKDGEHDHVIYQLEFDSSLKTKGTNPASLSLAGTSYIFNSAYNTAYIGDYSTNNLYNNTNNTNVTNAVYYAQGSPSTLFAIDGLSTGALGDLTVDTNGWIYSGGSTMIARFIESRNEIVLRDGALSGVARDSSSVVSLLSINGASYKFNLSLLDGESSRLHDANFVRTNNTYQFWCLYSTAGFYLEDDDTIRYNPDELQNKSFVISGLRDDLGKWLNVTDKGFIYREDNNETIGKITGFTITFYENALPARQSVTVTATDGNTYSVTLNYNVTLSGTNAADFTLVLPR